MIHHDEAPTARADRAVARPTTTFKPRRRALSAARRQDLERWLAQWGLDESGPLLDLGAVFGDLPVVLDIGFGHGETTLAAARTRPDEAIIGVEVHTPGVATVLEAIADEQLSHVRVVHGDVLRFLTRIAPGSLAGIRIFFPDPWPKARQHHRRLVRADAVPVLVDRLEIGGVLHLATDIADYADVMQRACAADARLSGGPIERPVWRPVTRFERRGLAEGRHPVDLCSTRTR